MTQVALKHYLLSRIQLLSAELATTYGKSTICLGKLFAGLLQNLRLHPLWVDPAGVFWTTSSRLNARATRARCRLSSKIVATSDASIQTRA